jgi:putative endopeptidase
MKHPFIVVVIITCFPILCGGKSIGNDILSLNIDTTVKPSDDFFKYANGLWLKNNPIPASESEWGITNLVQDEIYNRIYKICYDAAYHLNTVKGSIDQKIGDFYYAGMDTISIEKFGINALKPELERIENLKSKKEIIDEIALLQTWRVSTLFNLYIAPDKMNSELSALYISQGGLGLPNRDYYINTDKRTNTIRKKYIQHIATMLRLIGEDTDKARQQSIQIMALETSLALKSRKLHELRDPYRNYNKMNLNHLDLITPDIQWENMFEKMGIISVDSVIVGQPEYIAELEQLLIKINIDDWKAFLKWKLVDVFAADLNKSIDDENFDFYGRILNGRNIQRERWKRIVDHENGEMGEMVGKIYVEQYFSATAKKRYIRMIDEIFDIYKSRIEKLDWMSDTTKKKAIYKLSKVVKKVGYPDQWKDYSALEISRTSYVQNEININKWAFNFQIQKLGKPVDKNEWEMNPQTYNAYYNVSNNEIVFPAAIFLIPGLPDSLADDALAYSHSGTIIGHEITHGFDDEGRKFDANGNLSNWWTKEDENKFTKLTKAVVNEFDNYIAYDTVHVNGKATLGENIADLAGLMLAFDAFEKTPEAISGNVINGFSPEQRFFLGYANAWVVNMRKELIARMVMTDVHSPDFLRVNAPLSNLPAFYKAFQVKPGDAMYRPDSLRIKIW